MFRSGYRRDFPHRALSESEITEAIKQDEKQRKHREQTVNKSTHQRRSNCKVEDQVYAQNMTKKKFDPTFGPSHYEVIEVNGNGLVLQRLSDKQIISRLRDDVKFAEEKKAAEETLWFQKSLTKPSDTVNEPVVEQEQSVAEELTTANDTCVATEIQEGHHVCQYDLGTMCVNRKIWSDVVSGTCC